MTTTEILSNFLKGNELAIISEKQRAWLLAQAKREGVKTHFDGHNNYIYLPACHYQIKNCQVRTSGYGGLVGKKAVPGKYRLEKMYTIRFNSTGIISVCRNTDMAHYKKEGHEFTIINQLQNH